MTTGALFYDRSSASTRNDTVKPMVFQITFGMSVLYLVAVTAAVLLSPISPLSFYPKENWLLGRLHGIVGSFRDRSHVDPTSPSLFFTVTGRVYLHAGLCAAAARR